VFLWGGGGRGNEPEGGEKKEGGKTIIYSSSSEKKGVKRLNYGKQVKGEVKKDLCKMGGKKKKSPLRGGTTNCSRRKKNYWNARCQKRTQLLS